jgi:hypothetical protein
MPVILATQEAEIRRIVVWSQARANSSKILSRKNPSQKRAGGVTQNSGVGPEFKPQYCKKNKNKNKNKKTTKTGDIPHPNHSTIWPRNSTPRYITLRNENILYKTLHSNVHSSMFTVAKQWKQFSCPSADERTDNEILFGNKKQSADTYYNMKEASNWRGHIVWLHLYQISRIGKSV